jgi:hypothetical protein
MRGRHASQAIGAEQGGSTQPGSGAFGSGGARPDANPPAVQGSVRLDTTSRDTRTSTPNAAVFTNSKRWRQGSGRLESRLTECNPVACNSVIAAKQQDTNQNYARLNVSHAASQSMLKLDELPAECPKGADEILAATTCTRTFIRRRAVRSANLSERARVDACARTTVATGLTNCKVGPAVATRAETAAIDRTLRRQV